MSGIACFVLLFVFLLCVCLFSRLPLLVFIFVFFVFLSLCAPRRLWSFLFPRTVPSLRCVDPASCGGAAPFRGVLRVPHLRSASSAAGLVRSVWFPRHVCPLSRPTWPVFCAMAPKLWPSVGTPCGCPCPSSCLPVHSSIDT